MSYIDRLNKKAKAWKEAKMTSGFDVARGSYTVEIDHVEVVEESKAPFAAGQLELRLGGIILHGPMKGKNLRQNIFPEQLEEERNGKVMPDGQAVFKSVLTNLGIWTSDKPFPWEQLDKVMLKFKGVTCNAFASGKGNNCYLKSKVDPDEMVSGSDDDVEAPSADIDFDDDEEFKLD